MKLDKTNSVGSTQSETLEEPLSYTQFTQLLAQYKRAVYESIHQAENPISMLLNL
ncbi:response regulator [Spirosoma validum]|uniref:Uncharacterized protein n=1 Tax=Spirosoma validum TaxID=2771355 RepID=A0A927AX63_9BACT|nr:hypothetical protein [Spirosoma validum]MBD2751400.1 hypothetical protein [Spirosoma validum]